VIRIGTFTVYEYDLDTRPETIHIGCECGWSGDCRTPERAEGKMTEHALRKHNTQIFWKDGVPEEVKT
jgi:hypothetical protein